MVNEEDDAKSAQPVRSRRSKVFLLLLVLLVFYQRNKDTLFASVSEEEEEQKLIEEANSHKKPKKSQQDELTKGVNILKGSSRTGYWSEHAPPLVQKRPTRECSIRRIEPQVTNPLVYQTKKKGQRRAYACVSSDCENSKHLLLDFQDRRWKKVKFNKKNQRWDATFVLTDSAGLLGLQGKTAFETLYEEREGVTYINAYLGAQGLTGSLYTQHTTMSKYLSSFGCRLNQLKLKQISFDTTDENDCAELSKIDKGSWNLIKPKTENPEVLRASEAQKKASTYCTKSTPALFTKTLDKPLLLQKKRFLVSAHMLISSSIPFFVFFRKGFVKHSNEEGKSSQVLPGKWSKVELRQFQSHLATNKLVGNQYVETLLGASMKQIALFVFHANRQSLMRRRGSYLLLTLDFSIDENFHVFLERASEDFEGDPVVVAEMHDLVQEMHEVPVGIQSMTKGDKYGGWELLFSELSETCHKIAYNPCHSFIDFNSRDLRKANSKVAKVHNTANRERHESDRIRKKTEEAKKTMCKDKGIHYPGAKCDKLDKTLQAEKFAKMFEEHEKEYNPNSFRMPRPGEVFPWEKV